MRFLIDAQLPPALAKWLRESGHDAQAVREAGLREANDCDIWDHAIRTAAVLVTKDEDFPLRDQKANASPVIVWLRLGNSTNRILRLWFMPQLPQVIELIEGGVRVLEIR